MTKETEIKLQVADLKTFERRLKRLGAQRVGAAGGRVHEFNTIFDTPEGGLAKHGQLLRIRTESVLPDRGKRAGPARIVLTFKQPAVQAVDEAGARFKVREETELEVLDGRALGKIFE